LVFHQTSEDERCAQWLADRYAYIVSKEAGSGGSAGQYLGDSDWVGSPISSALAGNSNADN
jgi:hypothetical protein